LPAAPSCRIPDGGLGHLIDEADFVWQPPLGNLVPKKIDDLGLGDLTLELGPCHRVDHGPLVPLCVRQPDDRGFNDLGMRHDRILQLDGGDPFAARLDHVLGPSTIWM